MVFRRSKPAKCGFVFYLLLTLSTLNVCLSFSFEVFLFLFIYIYIHIYYNMHCSNYKVDTIITNFVSSIIQTKPATDSKTDCKANSSFGVLFGCNKNTV